MSVRSQPRISVVTPFYNTKDYLGECIESVLAQSHSNFEYLLVNNMSTDGSREIADSFARRDSRIRLVDNERLLSQIDNYNGALAQIAPDAKYVKMVQADDVAYPECLERLAAVAESDRNVGIVSSFYLWGDELCGVVVSREAAVLPGREACRRTLLERRQFTGSQTTVLYRADIVRARRPFYPTGRHFADSDAAFEIMLDHDLGYVPQILSFSRRDNDGSILTEVLSYHPLLLHFYLTMERYGALVLAGEELQQARRALRHEYFSYLGAQAVRLRSRNFWRYHQKGLASLGQDIPWPSVAGHALSEMARLALNPESTVERAFPRFARRVGALLHPSRSKADD